jgi:hypothetical protein
MVFLNTSVERGAEGVVEQGEPLLRGVAVQGAPLLRGVAVQGAPLLRGVAVFLAVETEWRVSQLSEEQALQLESSLP